MANFSHFAWSIDASEVDSKVNKTTYRYLKALSKGVKDFQLSPFTLLPLGDFGFHEILTQKEIDIYKERYKKLGEKLLDKAGCKDEKLELVIAKERTASHLIDFLSKHVKKKQADVAVLGAHHKSTTQRFFLGSFTENFLFHSKTPGLIVPTDATVPTKGVNRAMVTIDLYEDYEGYLDEVLEMLKNFGIKEVHLYNALPFHKAHYYHKKFINEKIAEREATLDKLKKQAEKKGFKVKTILSSGELDLPNDIVKSAQKSKAHMIVLKGKTSRAKSILVGSTTRGVLRASNIPCFVFR